MTVTDIVGITASDTITIYDPITINPIIQQLPDGIITLNPSGGSALYVFLWTFPDQSTQMTENITYTVSGTYSVIVIDNTHPSITYSQEFDIPDYFYINIPSSIYLVPNQDYVLIPNLVHSSISSVPNYITYKYKTHASSYTQFDNSLPVLTLNSSLSKFGHNTVLNIKAIIGAIESHEKSITIYHTIRIENISDVFIGAVPTTLTPAIIGGSGNYSYEWIYEDSTSATSTSESVTFINSSTVGQYKLIVTDNEVSSISQTVYFNVKTLDVNVGFQGKINTAGDNHNFIGGLYSKDNKMFNFFHNKNSALTSIENITKVNELKYAPIKSKNLSSTDTIDNTFNNTVLLNSDDYEISSDGKTVVEIFNGYNTCHKLILKTHIFNDSVYDTTCTDVCVCSTQGSSNPFTNVKLALSSSGKHVCVAYKIDSSTITDTQINVYELPVIEDNADPKSITSKIYSLTISNIIQLSQMYISDSHLVILHDGNHLRLCDFIHNIKTKNESLDQVYNNVSLNDRNEIFLTTDTQLNYIDWKQKTYFPVSTKINGYNFDITFSLDDTDFINGYFGVGDIINYDNIDYTITASESPNQFGYAVISILNNTQIKLNKVVNIVHFTNKLHTFENNELLNIDNNRNIFSKVIKTENDTNPFIKIEQIQHDGIINHIETLDLNLHKSFDKLCVDLNSYSNFTVGTYEPMTKQLSIENYKFNNTLNIGTNADANNNNIVIGHNTTTNGHNQIVIGSRSSGELDNSITLGNNETTCIVPRNNRHCNIGDNNYRINTFIGDNISFGNDHMNLPKSDGLDNQVLVRKGENNLEWGNIENIIAPFIQTIKDLQTRIELLENK